MTEEQMSHAPAAQPGRTPNLNKALAAFQSEMPRLERDRTVNVKTKGDKDDYSYSYATLANVTAIAMPLLGKHGLAFTALPGTGPDGKMALMYALLHESGEERSGVFPLSAEGGIQVLGGRLTFARRYCLMAVTGLVGDEDDDAAAAQADDEATAGTAQRRRPSPAAERRPRKSAAPSAPAPQTAGPGGPAAVRPAYAGPPLPGEEPDGSRALDARQRSRIMVLWGEVGLGGDTNRSQRLTKTSQILGRDVSTTNDLTRDEAETVIARLVARKNQLAGDNPPAETTPPATGQRQQRTRRESIVGIPDADAQAPWEPKPGEIADEHGRPLP